MCGIAGFFNGNENYTQGDGKGQWEKVLCEMNRRQRHRIEQIGRASCRERV